MDDLKLSTTAKRVQAAQRRIETSQAKPHESQIPKSCKQPPEINSRSVLSLDPYCRQSFLQPFIIARH